MLLRPKLCPLVFKARVGISGVMPKVCLPAGEDWLPINPKGEDMDTILRTSVLDLEKMKIWTAPKAERL